jgi:hypothetical protein
MKARREQVGEELLVIKLFAGNYARDLVLDTILEIYSNQRTVEVDSYLQLLKSIIV